MTDVVSCFEDKLFDMTTGLNNYFAQNVNSKHAFMITCGLMMDIMILTSFYRFALYGSTWRFVIAMFTFYGVRALT